MSYPGPGDSEFVFELLTCRWAERSWPPESDRRAPVVVARQLGTRERRWDTVVVEVDPEALAARREFGERELDSDLLDVVRHAPADWAWYRDALPHPGYPWRYVRESIHRAAARGVLEKRRRGNRIEIRRIAPYPEWARRIVAIENKPDLDASAARALGDQLAHDVEAGLADEVWVATGATGDSVEPALLEDIPVEVGILSMGFGGGHGTVGPASTPERRRRSGNDGAEAEVLWYPGSLGSVGAGGDGGTDGDGGATGGGGDSRDDLRARRIELAERAYGRGWRSYADTMRPDCRHFQLDRAGFALLPRCATADCHQTQGECSGSCPDFEPEPPAWRTRGWPIEGGPGKGIKRLLADRRERERDAAAAPADERQSAPGE